METHESSIPSPGRPHGPCPCDCRCGRCHRLRDTAQRTCVLCNRRIGYDREFVEDRFGHCYIHADCARARPDSPAAVAGSAASAAPIAPLMAAPLLAPPASVVPGVASPLPAAPMPAMPPAVAATEASAAEGSAVEPLPVEARMAAAPASAADAVAAGGTGPAEEAANYSWTAPRQAARRIRKAPPRRADGPPASCPTVKTPFSTETILAALEG